MKEAVNYSENEFTTMQSELYNSQRNSFQVQNTGIKLVTTTVDDVEHQRLIELRKRAKSSSKREPLEIPSYEEQELNQVPQGDNY